MSHDVRGVRDSAGRRLDRGAIDTVDRAIAAAEHHLESVD
jgi:hypothetical protein